MDNIFKDLELIEKSDLTTELKSCAQDIVGALHHLKALSVKLGIPMEQMTAEHVLNQFSRWDAKFLEHQARNGWFFCWSKARKA